MKPGLDNENQAWRDCMMSLHSCCPVVKWVYSLLQATHSFSVVFLSPCVQERIAKHFIQFDLALVSWMEKSSEILLGSATYRNSHVRGKKRQPAAIVNSFESHNLIFGLCFGFFIFFQADMKQPNFMTCSGEAGWWPAEINFLCLWPHSTEAKSRERLLLKKGLGPLYWITIDHSKNKYWLFCGKSEGVSQGRECGSYHSRRHREMTWKVLEMFHECDFYDKAAAV